VIDAVRRLTTSYEIMTRPRHRFYRCGDEPRDDAVRKVHRILRNWSWQKNGEKIVCFFRVFTSKG